MSFQSRVVPNQGQTKPALPRVCRHGTVLNFPAGQGQCAATNVDGEQQANDPQATAQGQTSEGPGTNEKKKKEPTPELRFVRAMLKDGCPFRLGRRDGKYGTPDTTFYQWVEDEEGARWQAMNESDLEGIATSWLMNNCASSVSKAKAPSCIGVLRSSLINSRLELPQREQAIDVVPLRNAYLLIDKRGVIRAVKPDRRFGQTHCIQADLDWSRVGGDGIYNTLEPEAGSYWHTYLSSTFTDPGVYEVAQEAFSMALLSQGYEKAVWMYGEGENGKSVMLHILRSLAPNATAAILLNRLVKNEFGTNQLIGKKLALVSEMPKVLSADIQGLLKALVSRDAVPGEFKGRDQFTFIPEAAWFMASNHHPVMPEHEHGWWRKVITLPFLNRVDTASKIIGLEKLITGDPTEMIQVIDWLLIGGARLTRRGRFLSDSEMPEAIQHITHAQRVESDTVAAWAEDAEPRYSANVWTSKQAIYDHYRDHVQACGRQASAANSFWKRIAERFRNEKLDTAGEQMTINGKRERYIQLVVADVKPGKVLMTLAQVEAAAAKAPQIPDADWPESLK